MTSVPLLPVTGENDLTPRKQSKSWKLGATVLLAMCGVAAVAAGTHHHSHANVSVPVRPRSLNLQSVFGDDGSVLHEGLYNAGTDSFTNAMIVDSSLIMSDPSAAVKGSTNIYSSLSSFYTDKASSIGLGLSYGMFSGSASMSRDRQTLTDDSSSVYVGSSSATYAYKTAMIPGDYLLTKFPQLKATMATLTESSSDNDLFAIFQQFGTHYVSELSIGGTLRSDYKVVATNYDDSDSSKNSMSLAASFTFAKLMGNVTAKAEVSDEEISKFQSASSSSEWEIIAHGGDPILVQDVDSWKVTVKDYPAVIGSKLAHISDLVYSIEGMANAVKVAEKVQLATERYLSSCPSGSTKLVCSAHGLCDFSQQKCLCDPGASGAACDALECPLDPITGVECGVGGTCVDSLGSCNCADGWQKDDGTAACTHDCRDKAIGGGTVNKHPVVVFNTHCLDWCLTGGKNCGKPAADEYCKSQGYLQGAKSFLKADGASLVSENLYCPTISIGDQAVHKSYMCGFFGTCYPDSFVEIVCNHNSDC